MRRHRYDQNKMPKEIKKIKKKQNEFRKKYKRVSKISSSQKLNNANVAHVSSIYTLCQNKKNSFSCVVNTMKQNRVEHNFVLIKKIRSLICLLSPF